MILIEHDGVTVDGVAAPFVTVTEPDCFKNDPAYYAGEQAPHYPMPAISMRLYIIDEYRKPIRLALLRAY